jgi:hypothetical protein
MAWTLSGLVVTDFISGTGIDTRRPVRAATTVAGTLASSFANGSVIDGVTLATGDRILLKNQATGSQNGIYVVQASGAPVRADDLLDGSNAGGVKVSVRAGTANAGTVWICTSASDLVGTDALTWTQQGQVTFTGAESMSNKTITSSSIDGSAIGASSASTGRFTTVAATSTTNQMVMGTTQTTTLSFPAPGASMTLTFPNIADTIVGRTTTDTLTNKTLTSPAINGGTINSASIGATTASTGRFTSVAITNASAQIALGTTNVLTLTSAQSGTASLTIPDLAGVGTTVATLGLTQTFTGLKTFASGVTFSSAANQIVLGTTNTLTLTSTQSSPAVLTFPNLGGVADTVAALALAQTMTNKTLTSTTNTIAAKQLLSATTAVDVFAATAPTAGQVLTATSGTAATWQTPVTGGITTLNTLTATTQTFATGTTGTDFNIASASSTHTFNLPDASSANRGVVTTGTQTLAGAKTFSSGITITSGSNQIVLSNGGTGITLTSPTQSGNGTLTIPNISGVTQTMITDGLVQSIFNKTIISGTLVYSTGTISQSGTTVTGVGTTFTAAMIGGVIRYPDSRSSTITGFTNTTTLTATPLTASSTTYVIYYGSGYAFANQTSSASYISSLFTDSLRILNSSDRTENIQFTFESGMATGTSLQLSANQTGAGKLIFPDTVAATSTLVATDIQQTITNKYLGDSTTRIVNIADTTRGINFSVTGTTGTILTLASGQTTSKTLTIPDITRTGDRFATEQTEQMLFRKTMTNGKDGSAATLYTVTSSVNTAGVYTYGGAWSNDGRYFYYTSPTPGDLVIYDTQLNTPTTIATGFGLPSGLVNSVDGDFVYVPNTNSNTVRKYTAVTGATVSTITVGSLPRDLTMSPTGDYLYVANFTSSTVSAINVSTEVVTTLSTSINTPLRTAVTYDGSQLYILNNGAAAVVWYTTPSTFGGSISTSGTVSAIVADVYRDRVYVCTSTSLQVINTVSKTIISTISASLTYISAAPNGDYLYAVSSSGQGYIYDISAGNLSLVFNLADTSYTCHVDPFGWRVAVCATNSVSFYDVRTTRYAKYVAGRASQSGETITGAGTRWWPALDGGTVVYANGTTADISIGSVSEVAGTSIASTFSQTVASQAYTIYHSGSILNPAGGTVLKNGLVAANPVFTHSTDDSRRLTFGMGNLAPGATVNIFPYATSNMDIVIPASTGAEEFVLRFATQIMAGKSFYDNTFRVVNISDDTKKIALSAGGNTTGITLTIASNQTTNQTVSIPNATPGDAIVLTNATQTLLTKTLTDPIITDTGTTLPSAPASGVKLFAYKAANSTRLSVMRPDGFNNELQTAIYGARVAMVTPAGAGATTLNTFGPLAWSNGTLVARTVASTSYREQAPRIGVLSTATAGTSSNLRGSSVSYQRGSLANVGGFFFYCSFAMQTAVGNATPIMFLGLLNSTGALSAYPANSNGVVYCGLGISSGTTLQFTTKANNVNQITNTTTGISAAVANNVNNIYEFRMYCAPNDTVLYYSLVQLPSNTVILDSSTTSTLPTNNALMTPHVFASNGATAFQWGIEVYKIYIDTQV